MDNGTTIKQLAFFGDLCTIAASKEDVQNILNVIQDFSSWTGLRLNAWKCGCCSSINSSSRGRYVEPFSPLYSDDAIPTLQWEDKYQYLSMQREKPSRTTGTNSPPPRIADKILASKVAEWLSLPSRVGR